MHPIGQICIYFWAVATLIALISSIVYFIRLFAKKKRNNVKKVFWISIAV